MSIWTYLLRRISVLPIILLGLYTIVFFLAHVLPADPARAMAGEGASNEIVQRIAAEYDLDKPLLTQFLLSLRRIFQGDFGQSIHTWRPVSEDLKNFFPATVELALVAMALSVGLGCLLGVFSAVYRGKPFDMLASGFSVFWLAMPQFWLGIILQIILCLVLFRLMPLGGRINSLLEFQSVTGLYILDSFIAGNWAALGSSLRHIILPAFTLGITTVGLFSRLTRTSLLNTLQEDYVRTARAVGHREAGVIWRAFRNAFITIVTIMGMQFGFLLGGTVAVETVFDFPGLGLYAAQSALTADYPAIMGLTLLFGVIRMLFNLLTDISYFVLDPRIRQ